MQLGQQAKHIGRVERNLVAGRVFEPIALAAARHVRANNTHRRALGLRALAQSARQGVEIPPLPGQTMHTQHHMPTGSVTPLPIRHLVGRCGTARSIRTAHEVQSRFVHGDIGTDRRDNAQDATNIAIT